MDKSAQFKPKVVKEIFIDFLNRRAGIINALTIDFIKFYQQCDPEKEGLCLYGFPNQQWKVDLPVREVPADIPEPASNINYARDKMNEKDWISFVAAHTDAWGHLFTMINDFPTISEVVTETAQIRMRDSTSVSSHNSNKSKLHSKGEGSECGKYSKKRKLIDYKDDMVNEEDEEDTICGACGKNYALNGFWICCDVCDKWFHGICVRINPARFELINHYICPSCHCKQPQT